MASEENQKDKRVRINQQAVDSDNTLGNKNERGGGITRFAATGDAALATSLSLTLEKTFELDRNLVRRLALRQVNVKESFTIRDRSGDYFRASLKKLSANSASALPYERMTRSPEPNVEITLACSILGRQRMIFVMQKATELGVNRIVPLLTDHSVQIEDLEHEKAASWPNQIIRAAKQCRRASLPDVLPPTVLNAFLVSSTLDSADVCVALDDRSEPVALSVASPKHVVLLIGPEGGFSDAERVALNHKGQALILGGRILRAETAVVVGLTAVQMRWGDFKS